MLNENAFINEKFFNTDVAMRAIRDGFGDGMVRAGEANPNVVLLCADLTESTRSDAFAKKFPDRFFEMGVAEQNMAAIAAGLGISGKTPFIASYAVFSPGRNWEQIRTTVCYNDANVKIAGHHAGLSVGPDGATHQALEDIALMRAMPNTRVIVPCDAIEARKATEAAAKLWGPIYLRFAREKTPVVTTDKTPFIPGKAEIFWQGTKPEVAIIACGTLVYYALRAAETLRKEKISVMVINNHSIKPLDEETIKAVAKKTGAIVTAEEHQIAGGLGSAIAEYVAQTAPVPMEFVGMNNAFGESGKPDELFEKYHLDEGGIIRAIKRVLKRKK